MHPLDLLVEAVAVAYAAIIAFAMLGGIGLTAWASLKRKWVLTSAGLLVAVGPFLIYQGRVAVAENALAERERQGAALARHSLPADYPRMLIAEGDGTLDRQGIAALMALNYFDAVHMRESFGKDTWYRFPRRTADCRELAKQYFEGRIVDHQRRLLVQCVNITSEEIEERGDAIMLRMGKAARNAPRGQAWLGGIVEVSMLQAGKESLIAYEEKPHIWEPQGFWSPFRRLMKTGGEPAPDQVLLRALLSADVSKGEAESPIG